MIQKLSQTVIKKSVGSVQKIVCLMCILAGIIVLCIVNSAAMKENTAQAQLYGAKLDKVMSEKVAFIDTVASGASSGVAQSDYNAYVDAMVAQYDDVAAVYACVKEDGVIYSDGIMTYMSGGWVPDADFVVSERGWFIGAMDTDGVFVSEPYVDEQSGNICITLSKKLVKDGEAFGVVGLDMYMDDLVKLIQDSYSGGNYVFLVSAEGTILTHPNSDIALTAEKSTNIKDALNGKYKKVYDNVLDNKLLFDYSGGFKLATGDLLQSTGWTVIKVDSISSVVLVLVLTVVVAILCAFVISILTRNSLDRNISPMFVPLEDLSANVSKISEGELDYCFDFDEHSEEVNALSLALNDTIQNLQRYIADIIDTVTAISEKNLDYSIEGEFSGDYEKIKVALDDIISVLNDSFKEVKEQANAVLSSSEDLSAASESVALAATSQSESVINASSEMERLSADMEKISEYADSIRDNAINTNNRLNLGKQEMEELVQAMNDISDCYEEIAGFISDINNIASQTNLLALNASIEAARAGEAGKGFAVVASEIGSLSQSSTESSEKIEEAINRSLSSVEKGRELVARTEQTISDSVQYSSDNTKMVGEIVGFVATQKKSAKAIFDNLSSISEAVENNASIAEENAAISMTMGECAQSLMDTISQFTLKEQ